MEKQFDIRMKEAKSCSNDEKIKFKSLIKREGHVNIKFFDRLWSNNPLTASIYIKDNLNCLRGFEKTFYITRSTNVQFIEFNIGL